MWNKRLVRLALLQHLRAIYGIKVKGGRGQCNRKRKETAATEIVGKIFGVPLNALPHSVVPEYGHIPSFLVDACTSLEEHIHTEGLFRKSGSVIRLKALKNKLDHGDSGLSSALPCDIAGLLKQFFRELPEPILPADLHEALFKAQELGTEQKNEATLLLSCLVPDHSVDTVRYFFNFLRNVSLRSSENKMDSSNLAVIFAPNLLQTSGGHEKMSANTEKKLRLQAAVVQTFIDYASDIGHVPNFILEKIPAMLGVEGLCATPSLEGFEEGEYETPIDYKRKRRQSVGNFVSGALNKLKYNRTPSITPQQERIAQLSESPVILTPNAKRKLPVDSYVFSSKKRRSIKHNFNFELLPSNIFSTSSTPVSGSKFHLDTSPEGSSQSSVSPVAIGGNHLISIAAPRRSKRIASKTVCRVESEKAGCFSPKISRTEKVRRSLRLKFSLGRSSKDNGCSGVNRHENVGRRLANQQSLKNRIEYVKTGLLFSPDIDERFTKKGSKKISKSEENLLTPEQPDGTSYRMSWTGPNHSGFQEIEANEASLIEGSLEVENSSLEPDIMMEKSSINSYELTPSNAHSKHSNSVTASSLSGDENNLSTETLVKIQKAFSESGSNLHTLINHRQSSITDVGEEKLNETSSIADSPGKTLFKTNDLTVIESSKHHTNKSENSVSERDFSLHETQKLGKEVTIKCYSTEMKVEHDESIHSDIPNDYLSKQELPSGEQIRTQQSPRDELNTKLKEENMMEENLPKCKASREDTGNTSSSEQIAYNITKLSKPRPMRVVKQLPLVETCDTTVYKGVQVTEQGKVSDHIQWFNKLSLNEPNRTKVKSPLKLQRMPVRQSVRRITSLLEDNSKPIRHKSAHLDDAASLVEAVSCDGAFSSCAESTSKDSLFLCTQASPREQKSVSREQSTVEAVSKSRMELTTKSFPQMKRHPDSMNAFLGSTRVYTEKVISDGHIKVPLEDLTNYDILKAVINNNVGFSSGIDNRVLRKLSEKERVSYKGSPKNPLGKVQLLPTSKPVDL